MKIPVLLFAVAATVVSAQEPEARVRRVEQGLLNPVVVRGDTAPGMDLRARMKAYNVPAVSIAVINDGRLEWARAYGVREAGDAPVDTATLFQAASISKPVAAMAALRLVEQGVLALDEPVNRRLRSWQVPENRFTQAEPVTLRRLLSHNAGLTVHGFRGYAPGEPVPTAVQVLRGEKPANSAAVQADTFPGSIWRYSGGGSTVVQQLMEDAAGRPFHELVAEHVLERAGMVHSTYEQPLPATRHAQAAVGHRTTGSKVAGGWHTYPERFAAGLWTTPSDLARLALEVQRSLRGASNRVLSAEMARQMLTVQAGEYGLGFGLPQGDGWRAFSHGGSNEGFKAMFFAFADRPQGAVVMTNGDAGSPLAGEILRAIAKEYGWPTYQPVVRDVIVPGPAALAPLAGTYTSREPNGRSLMITIRFDGTTLHASGLPVAPFGVERELFAAAEDRFFQLATPMDFHFERDDAGAATAVNVTSGGRTVRYGRAP